jgi:hypothetical protein
MRIPRPSVTNWEGQQGVGKEDDRRKHIGAARAAPMTVGANAMPTSRTDD